jgi:glycosyltransferase involved in cell wall biosynthesis
MSKVDIVIPCYNYGRFLGACVESVLSQRGVDLRVTIVDDASTDHSLQVAETLAKRDGRVRFVPLPRNVGMIPAVNTGLRDVEGDYFVKLDADDILPPDSLKRSVALLDGHPEVGFVYGRPRHFTGAPPRPRDGRPRWTIWSGKSWLELRFRRGVNCISQPEAVIRMRTLRQVGDYDPRLRHTSDLEMWLRLAAVSDVGFIRGVDQGFYRVHPDSMQRTENSGALKDLLGRREAFLSALAAIRWSPREKAKLEATVRRRLAEMALDHICWTYDRDRADIYATKQLLAFATETWPAATSLHMWRSVQCWRLRGRRSRWAPGSLLSALRRRTLGELAALRWIATGL